MSLPPSKIQGEGNSSEVEKGDENKTIKPRSKKTKKSRKKPEYPSMLPHELPKSGVVSSAKSKYEKKSRRVDSESESEESGSEEDKSEDKNEGIDRLPTESSLPPSSPQKKETDFQKGELRSGRIRNFSGNSNHSIDHGNSSQHNSDHEMPNQCEKGKTKTDQALVKATPQNCTDENIEALVKGVHGLGIQNKLDENSPITFVPGRKRTSDAYTFSPPSASKKGHQVKPPELPPKPANLAQTIAKAQNTGNISFPNGASKFTNIIDPEFDPLAPKPKVTFGTQTGNDNAPTGRGHLERVLSSDDNQRTPIGGAPAAYKQTKILHGLAQILDKKPKENYALFYTERAYGLEGASYLQKSRSPVDNWKWNDFNFIRVPISSEHETWKRITKALNKLKEICESGKLAKNPHHISKHMQTAISSYAGEGLSDFAILDEPDIAQHVVTTLPYIVDHCLKLQDLLARPIPKLKQGENKTLFVTKQLCCSLLANAFFCTYPEPQRNMPDINFNRFFNSTVEEKTKVKKEKLMCILNYFHQMSPEILKKKRCPGLAHDIVSFERRNRNYSGDLGSSRKPLVKVNVEPQKCIENMVGMLQVDFANKLIGGGVLGNGAVQEEVRFSVCPELIVSRLFTEMMNDDEAVFITGTQQFAEYTGYGSGFQFVKPMFQKNIEMDELGRMKTEVVAMDAVRFKQHEKSNQFKSYSINRELLKCYVAFTCNGSQKSPVATGNWGCGAFNGDTELKFLIQLIAASENERIMHYHTFGDVDQSTAIEDMMNILNENKVTTGLLYKAILKYEKNMHEYDSVFDFVRDEVTRKAKSGSGFR